MNKLLKDGATPRIFISYRHEDSAGSAGRLYDDLCDIFGSETFFRDVDQLESGVNFIEVIERTISACDALIVVIGQQWLTNTKGQRRLQDPKDVVRLEIEAALRRKIHVIPVLVHGATMPSPQDLPEILIPLTQYNACELTDPRWKYDIERLSKDLEKHLKLRRSTKIQIREKEFFTPWCRVFMFFGAVLLLLNVLDNGIIGFVGSSIFLVILIGVGKLIDLAISG